MDGGAVYLIQNPVNGKRYVGQTTKTVKERFEGHARCKKTLIGKAIHKYGKKRFHYGIIKTCATKAELDYWEKYFIAALKSKVPYGYNIAVGGHTNAHTPETVKSSSEKQLGKEISDEQRKNHSVIIRSKTEPTYPILEAELTRQDVMYVDLAKHLDLSKQSITDRMNGTKNFWLEEATAVRELLNVDMPLAELFRRAYEPVPKNWGLKPRNWGLYPVLEAELQRQGLSATPVAKYVGIDAQSFASKMRGEHRFFPNEMEATKEFLGVDIPTAELFRRADGKVYREKEPFYPVLCALLEQKKNFPQGHRQISGHCQSDRGKETERQKHFDACRNGGNQKVPRHRTQHRGTFQT